MTVDPINKLASIQVFTPSDFHPDPLLLISSSFVYSFSYLNETLNFEMN